MSKRHGAARSLAFPQSRLTPAPHEIQTRVPLQAAALQMVRGDDAERGPRPSRWFWDACPTLATINKATIMQGADYRGQRWGRLTIIGLLDKGERNGNGPASWVVRCDCGRFETRRAKAIREKNNPHEACERCEYVRRIRRRETHDRTGVWPSDHQDVMA